MSTEYFYDTATGEVSEGRQTGWRHRMGPYATRTEAENALETARRRTESWDRGEGGGAAGAADDD